MIIIDEINYNILNTKDESFIQNDQLINPVGNGLEFIFELLSK